VILSFFAAKYFRANYLRTGYFSGISAGGSTPTPGVVDWLTSFRRRGRR
jgi:hypothetical protein